MHVNAYDYTKKQVKKLVKFSEFIGMDVEEAMYGLIVQKDGYTVSIDCDPVLAGNGLAHVRISNESKILQDFVIKIREIKKILLGIAE